MAENELPEPNAAREWLATMTLIRRFEERAGEMYAKAKIGGFLHLAIGEEATIVGSARAMRDEDYLISTYRSHGHAIVRGTSPNNVMAELFGRVDGCSKGRGGSMHMFDLERRFMGGYGIVGGNLPIAVGLGLGADYTETEDAVLCQFGDGAANQGTFGEALNLTALWKLPVVFMVTNNQFGMGTALERHSAVTDLHKRGDGFGVPGMRCDGMDVVDTFEVTKKALRRAREDRQPVLVEAITYRFRGHSMADPEEYRSKEQVEEWRKRDPLQTFAKRLVDAEVLTEDDVEKIDEEAVAKVDEAVQFADQSAHPEPESLYDNIYVLGDQVRGWYSVDERAAGVHRGEREREESQDGARREQFEAVVQSQSGDIGDAGSGPSDSAKDSGKSDGTPDEAEDTEDVEETQEAEA
jgi:pyruvate dehydrogenase E1 component alpha subunit